VTPAISAFLLGGLGLIVGSFIGLVSLRLPLGEGVVAGRSRCGGCGRPLPSWRLVPLISWLIARGRCRDCGARIPIRYPLIEAGCALIGGAAGLSQPDLTMAAFTALLGWQLLLIAIVDGENFWLPDRLTIPLLITGLAASLLPDTLPLIDSVTGAVAGFATLRLLAWLYRRARGRDGLGGGDPFLFAAIGAWVGWIGLPTVLIWASAAGLSVVVAAYWTDRRLSGSSRLPFGVFLAVGAWFTWLYGPLGI
tara:strand:- start:407 stop:1159 length:753 start_codon:yes stop_codon:yes gene_type:complete